MKKLIAISLATFSLNSFAGHVSGPVERIYVTQDIVYFRLKGDSCKTVADRNTYWKFSLTSGQEGGTGKAWYSMLLAAATAGSVISAGIPDCQPGTHQNVRYLYQNY